MAFQHGFYVRHDGGHTGRILVPYPQGFVDAAVVHARGIFQGDAGENRIGNVQGPLVKGPDTGHAPANLLHRALDFTVGGTNPVADSKGPVEVNTQSAQEIGQQIPGRKAHRNAPYAAEGQQSGYRNPQ